MSIDLTIKIHVSPTDIDVEIDGDDVSKSRLSRLRKVCRKWAAEDGCDELADQESEKTEAAADAEYHRRIDDGD